MVLIVKCARCGAVVRRLVDLHGKTLREIIGDTTCRKCKVKIEGRVAGKLTITPSRILVERRKQI